jgi:hypothetical protein
MLSIPTTIQSIPPKSNAIEAQLHSKTKVVVCVAVLAISYIQPAVAWQLL